MPNLDLSEETLLLLRTGGVLVAALTALLAVRFVLLRRLKAWAEGTATRVDDLVLAAIRTPSLFWSLALALAVALGASPLAPEMRQIFTTAILALVILSMTLVGASVAGGAMTLALRRQGADGKVPGLGQAVVKGVVVLIGGMVGLNVMGVEIAPLLTALGVGGLAVALALQDTLTNFFAGLHILLERPYHIGNFIRLDDGQEGLVLDIGWRTTRIRTLADDVIVVPNSRMAGSTILNYHMPIRRSRVAIRVGVEYGSDAEKVRDVLVDVVRQAVPELDYLLAEPTPEALLLKLGDWSLDFELRFHITDIARQPHAIDQILRRILVRFRAEDIHIPFPVQTVHLRRHDEA